MDEKQEHLFPKTKRKEVGYYLASLTRTETKAETTISSSPFLSFYPQQLERKRAAACHPRVIPGQEHRGLQYLLPMHEAAGQPPSSSTPLVEATMPDSIYRAIRHSHNSLVGHNGVDNTLRKMDIAGNHFEHRREWVIRFIKGCGLCQKQSNRSITTATEPFTTSTYEPHECINLDVVSPLPQDNLGNAFISRNHRYF